MTTPHKVRPGRSTRARNIHHARDFIFAIACAGGVVAPGAFVGSASACSFEPNRPHLVDPQLQTSDALPPSAPVATIGNITRGVGHGGVGCGRAETSCDDSGVIRVQVSATDDQTPATSLGYHLELGSGRLPSGLTLPTTAVRTTSTGALLLVWHDGATDDQEALAFELLVRAVDGAGNEGPPTTIAVRDLGSGCSLLGRDPLASPGVTLVGLLALAAAWGRLRRRRG